MYNLQLFRPLKSETLMSYFFKYKRNTKSLLSNSPKS